MGKTTSSTMSPQRAMVKALAPSPPRGFPFELFSKTVQSVVGLHGLELPESFGETEATLKRDKQFCVGLLEDPVNHTWWKDVRVLGEVERTSLSGSMFLLRKVLPCPPDPSLWQKHAGLMSAPAPEAPADFLSFASTEVDRLFEIGWDRGYRRHVFEFSPTSSSCLEFSRRSGGVRTFLSYLGESCFQDLCLGEGSLPTEYPVRYSVVKTGGKNRGVTVASGYAAVLGPLHRLLYDHLCNEKWLLRGEAKGRRFSSFQKKEGEVFVSGDYESATDNLSLSVTEMILSRILSRARFIPDSIRRYAMLSLRAEIHYPGGRVVSQQRGQLMGNFLSFPLLCLQNYLAFRFSIPRDVPLRINGDDIVFRCRPEEYERWRKNVGAAGLTLSAGKTMVRQTIFSLNSAFFVARRSHVRDIPVVRSSMLVASEGLPSSNCLMKFQRGWKGEARRLVGGLWLRCFSSKIRATGRSVWQLGYGADASQLHTAGLVDRESYLLGSKGSLPLCKPLPTPPHDFSDPGEGKEWSFFRGPLFCSASEEAEWDEQHQSWCRDRRWKSVPRTGEDARALRWRKWWEEVKASGFESQWRAWRRTAARVRKLCPSLGLSFRPRERVVPSTGRWIPKCDLQDYACDKPGLGW
jgi:hypothetical protein